MKSGITIEFAPPHQPSRCDCCGGLTTRLTRFVHRNGDAYAVYYAAFSDNHPQRYVSVIVSIGEWADDAPPSGRTAFYLRIRSTNENFQVMVGDAPQSLWRDVKLLGKKLSRAEALADPRLSEIFLISDRIVAEDQPIIEYLSRPD